MSNLKRSYLFIKLPSAKIFTACRNKYFVGFCAFWLLISLLEFGQDYISAMLNGNPFVVLESLSYKLFWPLFIPFSIVLVYTLQEAGHRFSGLRYYVLFTVQIIFVTLVHLILFSLFLLGISQFIHQDPLTLQYLIYEKLSTRLYIAFSIYVAFSVLYYFWDWEQNQQLPEKRAAPTTITVKNGRSSVIVDVADIKWISSDGAYLDIHTTGQKHVVLDSLKNIINKLPKNFKRIHRSTIANIDRITELKSRGNGDYDVILDDKYVLRLSRNYTKPLKGLLL